VIRLLNGLVLLALSGCFSIGGEAGAPQVHYRLNDAGVAGVVRRAAPLVPTLLVQPLPADALADTTAIAYSRRPDQFAFYQLASWTERPVRSLPRLLQQRLQARGIATSVGLMGDALRGDWLLTVGIETLHHDVASPPGQARVGLSVELFDRRNHARMASRSFSAAVPTASADSAAAAAAMSLALAQAFDALLPWLEGELERAAAKPAS